jgi:hypothetical protein
VILTVFKRRATPMWAFSRAPELITWHEAAHGHISIQTSSAGVAVASIVSVVSVVSVVFVFVRGFIRGGGVATVPAPGAIALSLVLTLLVLLRVELRLILILAAFARLVIGVIGVTRLTTAAAVSSTSGALCSAAVEGATVPIAQEYVAGTRSGAPAAEISARSPPIRTRNREA